MKKNTTSFDQFAKRYDESMGDSGDYTHQNTIDPALFKAIGNFKGKVIYDLACGNGYIARKLARSGAKEVWASDISGKLISIAKTKYENPGNKIKYLVCEASDFSNLPKNHFDLIFMNMAIHYVKDLEKFAKGIALLLKPKGRFIFTTGHPLRKLSLYDAKSGADPTLESIVDTAKKYTKFRESITFNPWTHEKDLKIYYSPISQYLSALVKNGLYADILVEPKTKTVDKVQNPKPVETNIPIIYALGVIKLG